MSTVTPNTPEPGWEKRWRKQALELVLRGPITFAIFGAIFALSGFLGLLSVGATIPFLGEHWALALGRVLSALFLSGLYAWYNWRLFEMDTQVSPDVEQGLFCGKTLIQSTLIASFVTEIFTYFMGVREVISSSKFETFAQTDIALENFGALFQMSVIHSNTANGYVFLGLAWLTFHALPLIVGIGMDRPTVRKFSRQMSQDPELLRVDRYFFYTGMAFIIFYSIAGFFLIPLLAFYHAWAYVAMREIVGGIKTNQPQAQQKAVPA